jgi:hypothetical protein
MRAPRPAPSGLPPGTNGGRLRCPSRRDCSRGKRSRQRRPDASPLGPQSSRVVAGGAAIAADEHQKPRRHASRVLLSHASSTFSVLADRRKSRTMFVNGGVGFGNPRSPNGGQRLSGPRRPGRNAIAEMRCAPRETPPARPSQQRGARTRDRSLQAKALATRIGATHELGGKLERCAPLSGA